MRDPIALYTDILKDLSMFVDSEHLISTKLDGVLRPSTTQNKRLVMPTREMLRHLDRDKHIAFHPLCESIARNVSPVLEKTRVMVNVRLTMVICTLMDELLKIAADNDRHRHLAPSQSEFLEVVPAIDKETVRVWSEIVDKISPIGDNRVVNVYLKRGGKVGERVFNRCAIVSFPIADEFARLEQEIETYNSIGRGIGKAPEYVVFGVEMRKKDALAIIKLFNWLVPNNRTDNYCAGSNSQTAPFFDALMRAFLNVARHLGAVAHTMRKHLPDYEFVQMDLAWEHDIVDLSVYHGMIPVLDGNDGEVNETLSAETIVEPQRAVPSLPSGQQKQPEQALVVTAPKPFKTLGLSKAVIEDIAASGALPATLGRSSPDPLDLWNQTVMQRNMAPRNPLPTFATASTASRGIPPVMAWNTQPQQPAWGQQPQPQGDVRFATASAPSNTHQPVQVQTPVQANWGERPVFSGSSSV
jgi:hypothetical protein